MISIIICSINPNLLHQLKENIAQTIGVRYEIIACDNRKQNAGLCAVYNREAAKAKYEILCFIHEDILFKTDSWGLIITDHLKVPGTGLIGLAGGDTKGIVPSTWSTTYKSKEMNVLQHFNGDSLEVKHVLVSAGGIQKNAKKVINLDGVFLCTTREIFDQFKFDEVNLKGFHGYDIDYSLQVQTRYDVKVIFDVLVSHLSMGTMSKSWLESTLIITKKWNKHLPLSVYDLSKKEFTFFHWKSLQVFLQNMFVLNYSNSSIFYSFLKYSFTRYFTVRHFISMGKYVVTNMVKIKTKTDKKSNLFVGSKQRAKESIKSL